MTAADAMTHTLTELLVVAIFAAFLGVIIGWVGVALLRDQEDDHWRGVAQEWRRRHDALQMELADHRAEQARQQREDRDDRTIRAIHPWPTDPTLRVVP